VPHVANCRVLVIDDTGGERHAREMTCRVVIVAFAGFQPLDIVGPHEVFVAASRIFEATGTSANRLPYKVTIGSLDGVAPMSESGLQVVTGTLPRPSTLTSNDMLLVPGGYGVSQARHDGALLRWITAAAQHVGRVTSVCSGSLLLAQAGLLDGRRATTHWTRFDQLERGFPAVTVDRDALYVNDGNVWTSAGVTAGIDLALALVEADHGALVAQQIARQLVMFLRRPGGQSQFAAPVWAPQPDHELVQLAVTFIHDGLGNDLSVARVAAETGTSTRHLTRLFHAELGVTPARYIEQRRMELARTLIESDPSLALTHLARRCGFGTTETLRRTFIRHVGVAPDDYRHRFAVQS
jgi:transcriptional regulator GlxA family with amidase domain